MKTFLRLAFCFTLVACDLRPQLAPISSPQSPTSTSQPPTATSQLPTATSQPSTPSPLPRPTNTLVVPGTPVGMLGPDNFPDNVNPLTGEVTDPALLNHRPLAIKVVNEPSCARPQFGLN